MTDAKDSRNNPSGQGLNGSSASNRRQRLNGGRLNQSRPQASKPDLLKSDPSKLGASSSSSRRRRERRRASSTGSQTNLKIASTRKPIARATGETAEGTPPQTPHKTANQTSHKTPSRSTGKSLRAVGRSSPKSRVSQIHTHSGSSTTSRIPAHSPSTHKPSNHSPSRNSVGRRRNSRRSLKMPLPLLYLSRLVVAGLGIAAIGGTLLAIRPSNEASSPARTESVLAPSAKPSPSFPVALNQSLAPLTAEFETLPNTYPELTPKIFYIDVDTGDYVDVAGQDTIAAASTIKLPILLAFFEAVDAGRIELDQTIAIQPTQVAEGSGEMQVSPPGTQFTALEVATQMIVN
ncbi:MAG: serine hydrolase, partial [Phormidesmis sp.]